MSEGQILGVEYDETQNRAGAEFYKALLQAQMNIDAVGHDAQMEVGRGKTKGYASTEAVMRDGREALHKAGMLLIRGRTKTYEPHHRSKDKYGNETGEAMTVTYFRAVHAESAQWIEFSVGIPAELRNGMPADKAAGAGITYATRYAMVGLLCLPRIQKSEEPENRKDWEQGAPQGQGGGQYRPAQEPQGRPPQQPQGQRQGYQPRTSSSWSPQQSCDVIRQFWELTGALGDQPPEANLEKAATQGQDAVRAIGQEAKTALIAAMCRSEKTIREYGVEPERPMGPGGKPIDDLAKLHHVALISYAAKLNSASSAFLSGATNAQEGQTEAQA